MSSASDPTGGYAAYQSQRQSASLALSQTSLAAAQLAPNPPSCGGAFAFHPNLAELRDFWGQGKLAVVANVGPLVVPLTRAEYQGGNKPRPYQLFSHSDQQDQWQN